MMIKNSALLAWLALNGISGFVSIAPRTTGRLTTSFSSNIRSSPLFAVLLEQETETEVGRLKTMAAKLRAEAASLEEEQAHKSAELTQKAFDKFDLDRDGEISLEELKKGLEAAFKTELSENRVEKVRLSIEHRRASFIVPPNTICSSLLLSVDGIF
jgi:hypothetical protein